MPGYDRPLYVLPFDHRGSFQKQLFGISGTPTAEQTAQIASYKRVIYEGFLLALERGAPRERVGILVDEQFGAEVARDAKRRGLILAMPAEKSGQDEFDFEYGDAFGEHIDRFDPTFCKVLVRYNVEGDRQLNARQAERLARLSAWLHGRERRFMFELLVPGEQAQLERVGGDKARFDRELRPTLMVRAIQELQGRRVEPDVWKIEGIEDEGKARTVAATARANGRDRVGCIVLGRGENEQKVLEWLRVARGMPGYIGFAVGRTTFWDALVGLKEGRHDRGKAASMVADNYLRWIELFEQAPTAVRG
jgi:myo-inositol catabolism protein IolC